ncbi:MAG: PKD domain-containing protein, partial [Bacteroidota bacterium]|nr:PKD domain-containing protein [Bacteroidota bacterium]
VEDELPSNPFQSLKGDYAFLNDGSIQLAQLLHAQYYYDHFSDLLQGYDELRRVCNDVLAVCCPDEDLFPRHLLLGRATGAESKYRHRFIPSPAACCGDGAAERLRALLLRLAGLLGQLQIPVPQQEAARRRFPIRCTPSTLGPEPLSVKAIPYYYNVLAGTPALYQLWNEKKLRLGTGRTNLSYHARQYNNSDDWVHTPLRYDLEPYNFLRVEGHIGRHWRTALGELLAIKKQNRLPVDIVALNGDFATLADLLRDSIRDMRRALQQRPEDWKEIACLFGDLETQYDTQVAELRCRLGTVMRFLHDLPVPQQPSNMGQSLTLASALLRDFDSTYEVKEQTFGALFSAWYPQVKKQPYSSMMQPGFTATVHDSIHSPSMSNLYPLMLMYRLEKIYEVLPPDMLQLRVTDVTLRMQDAVKLAFALLRLSAAAGNDNTALSEEYRMHMDTVVRLCKSGALRTLYAALIERFRRYMEMQTFAMYAYMHSGIQHKAGVPMGGTFIMVYHQRSRAREDLTTGIAGNLRSAERDEERVVMERSTSGEPVPRERNAERLEVEHLEGLRRHVSREDLSTGPAARSVSDLLLRELRDRAKEDEAWDSELRSLVEEIPDGAVIADFYLPYICASDCPPINFICLGGEEAPDPAISVDGADFCASDKGAHSIVATPPDGELTSDAGGLQANDDGMSFVPTAVTLAAGATTTVTLTYTVDGRSVSTQLRVHRAPEAAFRVERSPAAANAFRFINSSRFATDYTWDFGDGGTDTAESPLHTYDEFGRFTVRLTADNDFCPSDAATQTVTLEERGEQAQCTGLEELHEAFVKLDDAISEAARAQFSPYRTARNIFLRQIPTMFSLPPQEQALKLAGVLPPALIVKWMTELHESIVRLSRGRKELIALYRILNLVLMFYACVQEGDYDQDPIPTEAAFNRHVTSFIGTWQEEAPPFNNTEKSAVGEMAADAGEERERTSAQAQNKKKYLRFLKQLLDVLRALE